MRKILIATSVLLAGLTLGGASLAGPPTSPLTPATKTICLDLGGETRAAVCRRQSSRLDLRDDICLCQDAQKVEAPVCGPGERPIGENKAFERARKEAARDGSLVGDEYDGRRMCVRARDS